MRQMVILVLAVLFGAIALHRSADSLPRSSATALSERALGAIRGSDPGWITYHDDCSYYNYQESTQVPWDECSGQPDGVTTCVKCEDGMFSNGFFVGGGSGLFEPKNGVDCTITHRWEGICRQGICKEQVQMGWCDGINEAYFGVQ